jgi:hypothetical protein
MKQKLLDKLFNKEMNRKEFMAHLGAGLFTILGLSGIVKTLIDFHSKPVRDTGYGSSNYGDKKTTLKTNV